MELRGSGADVKSFSNQADYGQFDALVLSAGYNNVSYSIFNENFRLCGVKQKTMNNENNDVMMNDNFDNVLAQALELAEPAQSELNQSMISTTSKNQLQEARFGATDAQKTLLEKVRSAATGDTNEWSEFVTAMT